MYKLKNLINIEKKFTCKYINFKKNLIKNFNYNFKNKLKLSIYIKKAGCNGFEYNFIKRKFLIKYAILFIKKLYINIDIISYIYLIGSNINLNILKNNKFIIKNKNIKTNCDCGLSFNIK